jgi:hypothetical protein
LEITAEITKEEYNSLIKSYYLNKNWTKLIAFLAILAFIIATITVWPFRIYTYFIRTWYGFFNMFFEMLFIPFCALPYGILYFQMHLMFKNQPDYTGTCVYEITENGINVEKQGQSKFYLWSLIKKVHVLPDFIVFKSTGNDIIILPVKTLDDEDITVFLEKIKRYNPYTRLVFLNN